MSDDSESDATIFVLFGATGDLAKRMVIPAFFQLSHDGFRELVSDALDEFGPGTADAAWPAFRENLRFAGGGFAADDPGTLVEVIAEAREVLGEDARLIHYISLPPTAFISITEALGAHDLTEGSRVVYEKPFGTSPQNFRELDAAVHEVLDESQVFRIDHFLGKEGTQNLHALRFGNGLFDGVWNREHIRAVQIDIPETLDIDERAEFYDATGAFLDMIVTHLFQVAAEIAMEPPLSMKADDLQAARESVIAAFRPFTADDVVFGQFEGYTDTEGVAADSQRDTFVAARLYIDTDRWRDVPFLLRTGKQLAASEQQVSLIFRKPAGGPLSHDAPVLGNVLTVKLSGSGSIDLQVVVKEPGAEFALSTATAALPLDSVEDADPLPPYVKLINDVIVGDRSLFTRPDGLEHAWEVITPILDAPPRPVVYERGSWGPAEAAELAAPDGWLLGE
jgi:glucose-6-phosphate 1-dehydrogenase